jgi:transcription-repair coupling factor (superfamily II helicase)
MDARAETIPDIDRLAAEITKGSRIISLSALTSVSAKANVLARLQAAAGKPFVIVTQTNEELEAWNCDLEFWTAIENPQSAIVSLPSFETDVYSGTSPHAETQERRALAFWQLTQQPPSFVVLSARSLITRTITPDEAREHGALVRRDEDFAPDVLAES